MNNYIEKLKSRSPLIHNITNMVTINDVANICLLYTSILRKVLLLQMNGVSRLSFILVTETVQFLRLQTYMRAIFSFVQQEIHLLQEQNIVQ